MTTADSLERGREAFLRQTWGEAYAEFSTADGEAALSPEDLEHLAVAAHLVGRDAESEQIWTRAHHEFSKQGSVERATRCAYWLAFLLLVQGEQARSSGWLARGRRLLDDAGIDCVEKGYLLIPAGLRMIWESETDNACTTFKEVTEIGERFRDSDLIANGRLGHGQALIKMGDRIGGLSFLDEVMVAAMGGELSPLCVGIVYCAVIETCQQIFDLRRAHDGPALLADGARRNPTWSPIEVSASYTARRS